MHALRAFYCHELKTVTSRCRCFNLYRLVYVVERACTADCCSVSHLPFIFLVLSVVRRAQPKLLLRIDRCAQHSGSVSEDCSDDRTAAIGNPQCMGIQNFTGVLKQAIAHTGHAAADDDDFRIVQAENGAQTVAEQLSGFSHVLRKTVYSDIPSGQSLP